MCRSRSGRALYRSAAIRVMGAVLLPLQPKSLLRIPARLCEDCLAASVSNRLRRFDRPVRIILGAGDPPVSQLGHARSVHELLPNSDLFLLPAPDVTFS